MVAAHLSVVMTAKGIHPPTISKSRNRHCYERNDKQKRPNIESEFMDHWYCLTSLIFFWTPKGSSMFFITTSPDPVPVTLMSPDPRMRWSIDWLRFTSSMRLKLISSVCLRINPRLITRRRLVSALSVVHFSMYIETNKNIPMTNQPKKRSDSQAMSTCVQWKDISISMVSLSGRVLLINFIAASLPKKKIYCCDATKNQNDF